jgi:hypothetical protein
MGQRDLENFQKSNTNHHEETSARFTGKQIRFLSKNIIESRAIIGFHDGLCDLWETNLLERLSNFWMKWASYFIHVSRWLSAKWEWHHLSLIKISPQLEWWPKTLEFVCVDFCQAFKVEAWCHATFSAARNWGLAQTMRKGNQEIKDKTFISTFLQKWLTHCLRSIICGKWSHSLDMWHDVSPKWK